MRWSVDKGKRDSSPVAAADASKCGDTAGDAGGSEGLAYGAAARSLHPRRAGLTGRERRFRHDYSHRIGVGVSRGPGGAWPVARDSGRRRRVWLAGRQLAAGRAPLLGQSTCRAQGLEGEVHAGWTLEGRAVQDVWIMPPRDRRSGPPDRTRNMYGTTLRTWDAGIEAWRIVWSNPSRACTSRSRSAGGSAPTSFNSARGPTARRRGGRSPRSRRTRSTGAAKRWPSMGERGRWKGNFSPRARREAAVTSHAHADEGMARAAKFDPSSPKGRGRRAVSPLRFRPWLRRGC